MEVRRPWLGGLVALAVVVPAAATAAAAGDRASAREAAPLLVLTERGVKGLRLGKPLAEARKTGLIGPTGPGCELVMPRPLVARLRPPLTGFATFSGGGAHPLESLLVERGAQTVRRIAPGATAAAVGRAYPEARLLTARPTDPIQLTALIVRRGGKDRIWFMLDRPGGRVTQLDIPLPQICE